MLRESDVPQPPSFVPGLCGPRVHFHSARLCRWHQAAKKANRNKAYEDFEASPEVGTNCSRLQALSFFQGALDAQTDKLGSLVCLFDQFCFSC